MMMRYIRLWPLYLLGTVGGLIILYVRVVDGHSDLDLSTYWTIAPLALVMVPSAVSPSLYPASLVAWSLFYEMVINILYATTFKWLTSRRLLAVVGIAGIGIVAAGRSRTGLEGGCFWPDSWIALARVGFSFPLGILIYRHVDKLPRLRLPAWLVLVLLTALLASPIPDALTAWFTVTAVLVVIPALVTVAVQTEPTAVYGRWFNLLGVTSYAIYMLHPPVLIALHKIYGFLAPVLPGDHRLLARCLMVAVVVLVAWLADRFYDQPARAWLTAVLRRRTAAVTRHVGSLPDMALHAGSPGPKADGRSPSARPLSALG